MNKKRLNLFRGPLMYGVLVLLIVLMVQMLGAPKADKAVTLSYSELLEWVRADLEKSDPERTISRVAITNYTLNGLVENSEIPEEEFDARYDFTATVPSEAQFYADVAAIYEKHLGHAADPTDFDFAFDSVLPEPLPWWVEFIPYLIMMALIVGVWYFMMRQQTGGKGGMASFGKSHAKLTDPNKNVVRFGDVAGADEEKEELHEIVQFLKDPQRFTKVGAKIPAGILLVGPPGTGKTLLARAVAGEAGVPFFTISGSDFVEMFVGVGASRVRDLFDQAKRNAPSIIFIDEIDAVGRQRGAGLGGGHDEREQTLNQLLVEMDGFAHNQGVIVMAATNRSDILDPALLRPGRFDRRIVVNYPDVKGREEILRIHARNKPLAKDVDLPAIARATPMFTGADLMNVMNEAAILTARRNLAEITTTTIEDAITRVMMGPEKKSHRVTDKDRLLVAYHEAGHAIVSFYIPECDQVREITTIPRGQAGGYTMYLPRDEVKYVTTGRMKAQMASSMGGRVAEALTMGDVSTGASGDIKHATEIARAMVTEYGMSEKLGPIFLSGEHEVFLGKSFAQQNSSFSDAVNELIDNEVRRFLDEAYARAKDILTEHIDQLHGLAKLLIEREKLDWEEFEYFMTGRALPERLAPEAPAAEESAPEAPAQQEPDADEPEQETPESAEERIPAEDDTTEE